MKRLHVHVHVEDLQRSIGFYAALFAAEPTVRILVSTITKRYEAELAMLLPQLQMFVSASGNPNSAELGKLVEGAVGALNETDQLVITVRAAQTDLTGSMAIGSTPPSCSG